MDREYLQHAFQEAVTSATSIITRAIAFATSGMIAFYFFSSDSFVMLSVASTLSIPWVVAEIGSSLSNESSLVDDGMLG